MGELKAFPGSKQKAKALWETNGRKEGIVAPHICGTNCIMCLKPTNPDFWQTMHNEAHKYVMTKKLEGLRLKGSENEVSSQE